MRIQTGGTCISTASMTLVLQVLGPGAEVARIELKEDVDIAHYRMCRAVGSERLAIAFIEVAPSECGRGIGTQAVRALEQRHRDRRLLA